MSQPPSNAAFAAALNAELAAFAELRRILQVEQDCLLSTDTDALLALANLKSHTVERLAELATQRAAYLQSQRLPPGSEGMQRWLAAQTGPEAKRLTDTWKRLLALAAEARAENQINGGLIGTRLGHNQAALATLQASARHHSVYGPDGQSDFRVANRELGRA
jgi:flagella synthesis protein FlgN